MTEAEWLGSTDPAPMLQFLSEQSASERKMRLLACACCRRIWQMLPDPRSRHAVEVAERFADQLANRLELARAREQAMKAVAKNKGEEWAAYWTTSTKASGPIWNVFAAAAVLPRTAVRHTAAQYDAELAGEFRRQVALVYEVMGNPFRPVRLEPYWLAWDNRLVQHLAEGIYADRAFADMPILGDALEDAGCDEPLILEHCRRPGEHVRGCWALDLVLGRK